MSKFFHFFILLFNIVLIKSVHAQRIDASLVVKSQNTVGINYLGAIISQERAIGRFTTLRFGAGAHYSFYGTSYPTLGTRFINVIDKNFGRNYSTSGITPYVFLEGRLYTNLLKRLLDNKNIRNNAGTYLALFGEVPFASGNLINVSNLELGYPVGIKIGLRRNLNKSIFVDGSAAIVDLISNRQRSFGPRLDVGIFWVF